MELLVTTHPGLEDLLYAELEAQIGREHLTRRPHRLRGRVEVLSGAPEAAVQAAVARLRTAHHALEPVLRAELPEPPTPEAIRAAAAAVELPEMAQAASFRVRAKRIGKHDFTSVDVERAVGAALVQRYGTRVKLDDPAYVVRADLVDRSLAVARPLTRTALSERPGQPFHQRVGLKANVAAALVQATGLEAPAHILDPFCGSGSILLEAGHAFEQAHLWGNDWVEKAAQGSLLNLEYAGCAKRARLLSHDARILTEHLPPAHFDAVITNPPFGVRIGKKVNFFHFYSQLLRLCDRLLRREGRLTLLTDRKATFDRALAQHGRFERRYETRVFLGDVAPWLVALERPLRLDH